MRKKRIDADALPASVNQALVDMLYSFMRTCASQGTGTPIAEAAGEKLREAIEAAGPPVVLQFAAQAVYRDKVLVPLEFEAYRRVQLLLQAIDNLGVQEIAFDDVPELDAALNLGQAMGRGLQGRTDAIRRARLRGIRVRTLPHMGRAAAKARQHHVLIEARLVLALEIAQELRGQANSEWSWPTAISLLRQIESAMAIDRPATLRAMERVPGVWSASRRAVGASVHVACVLDHLGVAPFVRRAAAHAALALGMHGYGPREGMGIAEAAEAAVRPLTAEPPASPAGVTPHRLRVLTLLHALAKTVEDDAEPKLFGLLRMAYHMERRRCPEGATFHLTVTDLVARAMAALAKGHDADWAGALVAAYGIVPMGSYVLADGRLGIAAEPAEDPWRPRVLIANELVAPVEQVALFSPLAMARRDE